MAPKPPWNRPNQRFTTKNDSSTSPRPSGGQSLSESPINYEQVQADEVEVLKAIFMEDYEETEVKGAWSKTTDPAFKLRLRAYSDPDTFVILAVKMTATYPKSLPLLQINTAERLRPETRTRIYGVVENRPKELVGEVMIHEIATAIQEILEDAVQSRERDVLPSLEDERTVKEAALNENTRLRELKEARSAEEAQAEESRILHKMVEDEMLRRSQKRKSKPQQAESEIESEDKDDIIRLDQPIVADNAEFRRLRLGSALTKDISLAEAVSAIPKLTKLFAVRRVSLKSSPTVVELERELESIAKLRHPNLLSVYTFKLERDIDTWELSIVTEHANRGSLGELLDSTERLSVTRSRSWAFDLLEALDFLHRNGVVHGRIHANNVLCARTGGATVVKLSDAGFRRRLHQMQGTGDVNGEDIWAAPELHESVCTKKTDVWQLGVVLVQMLFGLETPKEYTSPNAFANATSLSEPCEDVIRKFFQLDSRKRPSAFDLMAREFFRSEAPALSQGLPDTKRRQSSSLAVAPYIRRSRHNSNTNETPSRYVADFTEVGRLGKGGFGEVVKARNKLDGGIYAIKKIRQSTAALSEVLSEVVLLHRLNHPYVVRYYSAWLEKDSPAISSLDEDESAVSTTLETSDTTSSDCARMEFGHSTGLDFVSSSGQPDIVFGDDDDDDEDEDEGGDSDSSSDVASEVSMGTAERRDSTDSVNLQHTESGARRQIKSTLYIQMEYCERQTLRDIIRKDLFAKPDEAWRLFRQTVEGLAHIHSHGIIHRDLKPDNIFIDVSGSPRIGDFGLATTGQHYVSDKATNNTPSASEDMTRSVGTALYVAPELKADAGGNYNDKVDMYSLGIIFFEMCFPLKTAMERHQVLQQLRQREHTLPAELLTGDKVLQGSIIEALVSHKPSERPSSTELLRSGKLPLQIEDETFRQALRGLSNTGSQHYQQMMSVLFSQKPDQRVKDIAWDLKSSTPSSVDTTTIGQLRTLTQDVLQSIFRRHGAQEGTRPLLLPRSTYYTSPNVVQLLDPSGNLLQLPFDLTLPYARYLATDPHAPRGRTYTIGKVYRDAVTGGPPRSNNEADFDIVSDEPDTVIDAEVLKVVDEVIDAIPSLASSQVCYHVNHTNILEVIMDFCRIGPAQRQPVKEVLSKLNFHQVTWQKVRAELRSPLLGIQSTSLDDMGRFDFRETPDKAIGRLKELLGHSSHVKRTEAALNRLKDLVACLKAFGIGRKIYVCPLSSFNERFYAGGILFQCVLEKKNRDVLAAGGRYDSLVQAHRSKGVPPCSAVGVSFAFDRLVASMVRYQKSALSPAYLKKNTEDSSLARWNARTCDVLVASFDRSILRSAGLKILSDLWANEISAEMGFDAQSMEELFTYYKVERHQWLVIVKHDNIGIGKADTKVRNLLTREDTDVQSNTLVSHLRQEMRERDHREGSRTTRPLALPRQQSQPETSNRSNVQVLLAQHRSKKSNKYNIVEAAQQRWSEKVDELKDAPIIAIETRDDVLELIRDTRLSDPETWRRATQSVQLGERQYLGQVHDLLLETRKAWKEESGMREACVYNFRTGHCIYYDVGQ
ncbi:eukaryotic translation initiation factor 2-alpha kinase [Elasticomyces elasticus]|nr:eukaryotic translation initiation factor 2-alpha kinase [Elasticomyces elasticus]